MDEEEDDSVEDGSDKNSSGDDSVEDERKQPAAIKTNKKVTFPGAPLLSAAKAASKENQVPNAAA